ncbi:hypothetical protein KUC3_37710 [Alteromonas sp. KC3]|nr:hypothetical protein KUC3_37710 [Alteromonas sp. KC3]BCO24884.1 hypothetical protein KUC14_37530 [Alteromonas sp. KC14]
MRLTLFVLLSIALVALIFTASNTVYFFNKQYTLSSQFHSLKLLAQEITYHDEVLSMSALAAALDDDNKWRDRYLKYEASLDKSLQKASELDPRIARFFEDTAQANNQLIALEKRAFELAAQNQRAQAVQLLKSDQYQAYKMAFSEGLTNAIDEVLKRTQFDINKSQEQRGFYLILSMVISFLFVLVLWYFLIRYVRLTEKAIEGVAKEDELSGLLNRREFNRVMKYEINRAHREKSLLMLIILDLDEFKRYNDKYGHPEGDAVIERVGKLLTRLSRRANEYAFRTGGEEFAFVATCDNRENGLKFCQSLCEQVAQLNIEHISNPPHKIVTASCGIAFAKPEEALLTITELYSHADKALYQAKHAGKNQYAEYNHSTVSQSEQQYS